tara:strand:+ start:3941 stop:4105 length:165 start_codon:yes stop_codon:yes gene_type:complete
MGRVVRRRGAGRQTDWANKDGGSAVAKMKRRRRKRSWTFNPLTPALSLRERGNL